MPGYFDPSSENSLKAYTVREKRILKDALREISPHLFPFHHQHLILLSFGQLRVAFQQSLLRARKSNFREPSSNSNMSTAFPTVQQVLPTVK